METEIGKIIHFYDKIGVAVVRLSAGLKVGDEVHVKGAHTDFKEVVESMQVEHESVKSGKKGEEIAVKLNNPARKGDLVFK